MASRLTCSSAQIGPLEPQAPENPLEPPADLIEEVACKTCFNPEGLQPLATEKEILTLRTRLTQLEGDLAVAHARIQDLTQVNSFLRCTASNPAPTRANESTEPPPPSELSPLPESLQTSIPPLGHSRLSSAPLVTCLGESLPAGVGLNKSDPNAPVFNGMDRELYKDRK